VARGASVVCFDPLATAPAVAGLRAEGMEVSAADSAEAACAGADAVVVATEWPEFRVLEWREIARQMRGSLVADARHVVDVEEAGRAGLTVVALGVVTRPIGVVTPPLGMDAARGSIENAEATAVESGPR
jgi:UDPglucose 6-dehydrogenase